MPVTPRSGSTAPGVPDVGLLYERYGYAVFRRCLRLLGDEASAADVLQETFVRVLRYGARARVESPLPWLHRIADRACLDRIARERRRLRGWLDLREAVAYPDAEPVRLVRELLANLPRRLAHVAILHHVDGMEQADIARTLGCSTMTVKRRLRALRKAARALTGVRGEEGADADLAT